MSDTVRSPSTLFFQHDHIRRSVIASYWVIIILAIPLWWSTTSIERLALPAAQVASQAQTSLQIPVALVLDAGQGNDALTQEFENTLSSAIRRAPQRWESLDVHLDQSRQAGNEYGTYVIVPSNSENAVVKSRQLAFPLHLSAKPASGLVDVLADLLVPFASTSQQEYRVLPYSTRYRLSFSLLHEDAATGNFFNSWEVEAAIFRHISPIISQLSALHNFTTESQVQFHARLAFNPQPLGDGAFGISPEDLSVFVNSAEWTLSSSVSNDPVIHFVLFVPSASRRPLHILDDQGSVSLSNAFLLPQWGSIVILNPDRLLSPSSSLSTKNLDPIFTAFASHLLDLLGAPNVPTPVEKELRPGEVLTDWQLDALLRYRTLSNARGSKNTLQSIIKLVNQIEHMPVGPDVKGDVQEALVALEQMSDASVKSLTATFRYSARAFTLASRAFFNPGMLALLYFPAEHKYAVYTPLFASAGIPLLVTVLKELRAWKKGRMARTQPVNA